MNPNNERMTLQKELVYREVLKASDHPVALTVWERIHAGHPAVSRSTVYRNLALLADQGKIRRIAVPGGPEHFDRTLREHYHVVCTRCGSVADVEVAGSCALMVQDAHGYEITGKDVVFEGLCPACRNQTSPKEDEEE